VNIENKANSKARRRSNCWDLPANTSTDAEAKKITSETQHCGVPGHDRRRCQAGVYKSLVCRATVTVNGEPVVYTQGTGELRVDEPLPPKVAAPAAAPAPAAPQPQAEAHRNV
jgi:hypothetical protein